MRRPRWAPNERSSLSWCLWPEAATKFAPDELPALEAQADIVIPKLTSRSAQLLQ